ncbi:MAG: hypothetical protein WCS48_03755 [Candidatus Izemoplasmatales bacterium]|nr:hypothetical protein [Candidatus Izemoplasmatales bacterium]
MLLNLHHINNQHMSIKSITVSAMLLAVLIAQEYALMAIPNVQLTVVLIMAYASVLPWATLLPVVAIYVLIDNMIMGSLSILYFWPMLVAWLVLAIVSKLLVNKDLWVQVVFALIFGFIYGWFFAFVYVVQFGWATLIPYLISDFPFEVIMAINNFVTVSIIYLPIKKTLGNLMNPKNYSEDNVG